MAKQHAVAASELAEYVYCECCWWDLVEGRKVVTPAMQAGTAGHIQLAKRIESFERQRRIAIVLAALGLLLLAIVLIFAVALHLL